MLRNRGIAFKLILFVTASGALVFLTVFACNYRLARAIIERNVQDLARNLVGSTVSRIEARLAPVQKVPENLAGFLETAAHDREKLLGLLRTLVEDNADIYGSTVSFEPYAFDPKLRYFAPYFYKSAGRTHLAYLEGPAYDYFLWDWYQIPKELNRPDWSEPFFDEGGGNILMSTYSVPFYSRSDGDRTDSGEGRNSVRSAGAGDSRSGGDNLNRGDSRDRRDPLGGGDSRDRGDTLRVSGGNSHDRKDSSMGEDRRFAGIVTADISLDWLTRIVSSIKVLKTGYAFLISKNGTLVTHPRRELIMNATLFGVAEMENDPNLRAIAKKMIRGESGFVSLDRTALGRACRMYYAPIPSCGWSLAVIFPQDELMADVARLNRVVVGLGAAGILLLCLAVVLISRSITRPLVQMAGAAQEIGRGNLDTEITVLRSGDEVGRLSVAIDAMKKALRDYIARLTETTAVKERMESELKIARDIQMSTLPQVFPPFPERREFDLFALMEPAREVGGDFYDFFLIAENRLAFVIGDVSGKGIPAALFMAATKTLIKVIASQGLPPGEALTRVNRELCQGNDSCMFVTVLLGILCTDSGEVLYANAGHPPPLVVSTKQSSITGASLRTLAGGNGLVVGALAEARYVTESFRLEPGDSLFLYTDGVTEAQNERGEMFAEERLRNSLDEFRGRPLVGAVRGVLEEIRAFGHGVPQYDDITMLMLGFRGNRDRKAP